VIEPATATSFAWTADRSAAVGIGAALLVAIYLFFFGKRKAVFAAAAYLKPIRLQLAFPVRVSDP